jgi:hypothetical protein
MESVASRGGWCSARRALAFEDAHTGSGGPSEVQRNLSADLNPVLAPAPAVAPANPSGQALPPVWLQRVWRVLYVLFCAELGLLLIALPWRPIWRANRFLAGFPALHAIFESYFLRGIVSGIGVIDLYLGASAVMHFTVRKRERASASPAKPAPDSRPSE